MNILRNKLLTGFFFGRVFWCVWLSGKNMEGKKITEIDR
jgi:hypothetical protein